MSKAVKLFGVSAIALVLGGCLSAGTNARLCSDLGFIGKVANAISSKIGAAVGEYTPKKCLDGGINGDTGNLTGGVSIGVHNEPTGNPVPQE